MSKLRHSTGPLDNADSVGHNLATPKGWESIAAWSCSHRPRVQTVPVINVTEKVEVQMATDYDAPRKTDEELAEDSLEELKARRADKAASAVDVDETELAENLELPGADLSDQSLTVRVLPRQEDEFTCSVCFLVHHRSQLASDKKGVYICTECI